MNSGEPIIKFNPSLGKEYLETIEGYPIKEYVMIDHETRDVATVTFPVDMESGLLSWDYPSIRVEHEPYLPAFMYEQIDKEDFYVQYDSASTSMNDMVLTMDDDDDDEDELDYEDDILGV